MMRSNRAAVAALLAFVFVTGAAHNVPARADEIHVMISGGFTAPYDELVAAFETETGHRLMTVQGASMGDTPTAIPARLARNEPADVVILARSALDLLVQGGKVKSGSETDLVRSPIGFAVKQGAPVPDISTAEKLKQVLLAAKSVAYSDSSSGVYVNGEMFGKLGIAEQMKIKAQKVPGSVRVGTVIANGQAEVGFQQMSELLPIPGITVVGEIPDAVQKITVFSAGIAASSKRPELAKQLIDWMAGSKAWKAIRKNGLEPVSDKKRRAL